MVYIRLEYDPCEDKHTFDTGSWRWWAWQGDMSGTWVLWATFEGDWSAVASFERGCSWSTMSSPSNSVQTGRFGGQRPRECANKLLRRRKGVESGACLLN